MSDVHHPHDPIDLAPGDEDEGRIGTELTNEGSKPIERLDFALYTEDAKRGILPDGKKSERGPWFDSKGFFEEKLRNPGLYDQGKYHANPMDALRMPKPNLQSNGELEALVTMLLGSTDPTLPPEYMFKLVDRRRYIEDGWWIVRILEARGVHSNGRTLEEARRRVREALSLDIGDTAFSVEFTERIALPPNARRELSRHLTARRRAEDQTQQAMKAAKGAARALARAGLSVRDAGSLLGLTGARVSQILKTGQRRSG